MHKDYQSELKYLVTNDERIKYIATTLRNIKESGNTLILVDRISAGEKLSEAIPNSIFINLNGNIDNHNIASVASGSTHKPRIDLSGVYPGRIFANR